MPRHKTTLSTTRARASDDRGVMKITSSGSRYVNRSRLNSQPSSGIRCARGVVHGRCSLVCRRCRR